ncbi:hypothetical protein D3C72_1021390 [compost metagenome]
MQGGLGGDGLGVGRADALQHAATLALDADLGGVSALKRLGHARTVQTAGEQRHRHGRAGGKAGAICQVKTRQVIGRAAVGSRKTRRRQVFGTGRSHIGLRSLQGVARSQNARVLSQGYVQRAVEIGRQPRQDWQGFHIGRRLADHGGIGRARHGQLRLGICQIGVRLGQTGFGLGHVGAGDLAHFEAGVGFVQLATQDGDVLLANAQDFHVPHHIGIGLNDRGHHLLLDITEVLAAGADIGLGGVDAACRAPSRPDVLRQADAGGGAVAFGRAADRRARQHADSVWNIVAVGVDSDRLARRRHAIRPRPAVVNPGRGADRRA